MNSKLYRSLLTCLLLGIIQALLPVGASAQDTIIVLPADGDTYDNTTWEPSGTFGTNAHSFSYEYDGAGETLVSNYVGLSFPSSLAIDPPVNVGAHSLVFRSYSSSNGVGLLESYVVNFNWAEPTPTPTITPSPTQTSTSTPTATPTPTPTQTATDTPTQTPTSTPTVSPTNTSSPTPTIEPTETPEISPSATPTTPANPSVTATPDSRRKPTVSWNKDRLRVSCPKSKNTTYKIVLVNSVSRRKIFAIESAKAYLEISSTDRKLKKVLELEAVCTLRSKRAVTEITAPVEVLRPEKLR